MPDIFLSYAKEDAEQARVITTFLSVKGYSVWSDRNLTSGDHFHDVIAKNLDDAKCAVVLWSENSVKSNWVLDEARRALQANRLLPVFIDDLDIHKLPLGFGGVHCIKLSAIRDELEASIARLGVKPIGVDNLHAVEATGPNQLASIKEVIVANQAREAKQATARSSDRPFLVLGGLIVLIAAISVILFKTPIAQRGSMLAVALSWLLFVYVLLKRRARQDSNGVFEAGSYLVIGGAIVPISVALWLIVPSIAIGIAVTLGAVLGIFIAMTIGKVI